MESNAKDDEKKKTESMPLYCAPSNANNYVHFLFITLDSYHVQHRQAIIALVLNFLRDTNEKYPPFLACNLIFVNSISPPIFTLYRTTVNLRHQSWI